VLPAWVSAYYVPLIPNPDGLGCGRDPRFGSPFSCEDSIVMI
jgi:hypothetical protein